MDSLSSSLASWPAGCGFDGSAWEAGFRTVAIGPAPCNPGAAAGLIGLPWALGTAAA